MRSRSRGKQYSTTMDNENKMKMKKTKTTTMMENNANENDQRKERSRGTTTRRKRNSSVTCKATTGAFQNNHVFSAAAAAATGGGTTKLWSGKPERRVSFGHPPMHRVYFMDFFVSRPFVSYDVCDLSILLLFGPNSTIRVIVRERRVGDMLDFAVCENHSQGREHLPKQDEPAVYVANHASFMDIFSLFHLKRPFKFISKTSNFIIPIIGWSMFLTGHVPLKRTDRRSQMETLKICRETLQKNGSVLFFPEGTRSKDGTMAEFKKGAFSVAAKEKVPIVPITIVNASGIMRNGKEWMLRKGEIKVIVHPRIEASENADELCQKSENVIKEALVNNS